MIDFGHTHTDSEGWKDCPSCNPNIKPKIIAYIYDCIKCGKQFAAKKKKKKKKQICKNCK
ncbi:MAG: hypothetical protein KAR20_12875 [Candidatus Heimdallarchaeota archaeon]|nr:hypothetical protein [Candidatus Heimdallarchaeota archaeon]